MCDSLFSGPMDQLNLLVIFSDFVLCGFIPFGLWCLFSCPKDSMVPCVRVFDSLLSFISLTTFYNLKQRHGPISLAKFTRTYFFFKQLLLFPSFLRQAQAVLSGVHFKRLLILTFTMPFLDLTLPEEKGNRNEKRHDVCELDVKVL